MKRYDEIDFNKFTDEDVIVPSKMLRHMLEWADGEDVPEDLNERAKLLDEISK